LKFINAHPESRRAAYPKQAIWWYLVSLLVLILGVILAAWYYPGGFDWPYTVISALASKKHNPAGSFWFSSAFILSMGLLWPYVSSLKKNLCSSLHPSSEVAIGALRLSLICGALVAAERLFIRDLSAWVYKAHEILALLFFLGLYIGVLVLLIQATLRQRIYVLPVILIATPLLAIGITQFWLYFEQRDIGWVDTSWREKGIPIWLSFAFWQWFAIGFLWASLGLLSFIKGAVQNGGRALDLGS
jgi:hypothetical protein